MSSSTTSSAGQQAGQNGNVNGFLIKLWRLLENSCDNSIVWSDDGRSFIISDPHSFSQSLSKYFKHSKLSSFIRQLNMYGFRKVTSNLNWKEGSDIKVEDDLHFYHPNFRRGEQGQLALIRRKMPSKFPNANQHHSNMPTANGGHHSCQDTSLANGLIEHSINGSAFDLNELRSALNEVRVLDIRQNETSNSIMELKHENETLWTELLDLRTKYNEQRDIITTLIKFIVDSIQSRFPVSKNRKFSNLMIGNLESSAQLQADTSNYKNGATNSVGTNNHNNHNSHNNHISHNNQTNHNNYNSNSNHSTGSSTSGGSGCNNQNQATGNRNQIQASNNNMIPSALIVPSSVASCSSATSSQTTNELSTWLNDQLVNDASEACGGLDEFMDLFGGEIPLEEDEE